MNAAQVQMLLASANYYKAAIDGDVGPLTMRAIERIEANDAEIASAGWTVRRRLVAAAQRILNAQGFEAGTVDGYDGHNTLEALVQWQSEVSGTKADTRPHERDTTPSYVYPTQKDVTAFYGPPGGAECTAGKVSLPMPFRIAWNTSQTVTRFSCHAKVEGAMTTIFHQVHEAYGPDRMRALGLDLFGGCYNFRKMRGGSSYSMHSWGIAVDLDPTRNQLRWKSNRASFARPDYEEFWQIVEANGAVSLGRERNFDWMHFQFARLN